MNFVKVLFGFAGLMICCATLAHSLKCYSCTDKKTCKVAPKYTCNLEMAYQTRNYLEVYHKNVENTTSSSFACFRETHKSLRGEIYYKGCIYSHVLGCSLEMKDFYTQNKIERQCYQCNSGDGCNPAGRADLDASLPMMAIVVAAVAKFLWTFMDKEFNINLV